MTVLDAFAVLAVLKAERGADEVRSLIEGSVTTPTISTVNQAEIFDHIVRVAGRPVDVAHRALNLLELSGVEACGLTSDLARRTGDLRASHYHRSRDDVSLADCACAATAEGLAMPLATADGALARMARSIGLEVIALADSRGRRP